MDKIIAEMLTRLKDPTSGYVRIELTACPTVLRITLMKYSSPIDLHLDMVRYDCIGEEVLVD